jgi:uncharacterized RDD family membrane protein YckC
VTPFILPALFLSSWQVLANIVGIVVAVAYPAVQMQLWGRTIGMRALGIRVVPITPGAQLTAGQAWLRCAVDVLPAQLPFGVGTAWTVLNPAWLLWDKPNRQALHDKVARTVVVSTR